MSPETHLNATLEIRFIVAVMATSGGDDDVATYLFPIIVLQREAIRVIRQVGADLSFVTHAEATRYLPVKVRIRDVSRDLPATSVASTNRASDARLVHHGRRDTVHRLLADGLAAGSAVARSHDE